MIKEKEDQQAGLEQLKKIILEKEEKRKFFSEKFAHIEMKVKQALQRQETDEALKEITVWALNLWASDVHYEVFEKYIIIRFRIDWKLIDIFKLTKEEYKKTLERIKYSAWLKLNITEIPQDWKYSIQLEDKKIEIRVSTLPTKYWENAVCRVLDPQKWIINFEDLGFFWTSKRMLEKAIAKRNWMILVTWPTWSGKTTTLYTMLKKINTREKKIITLEDPIEYELEWIVQSEIDEKKWLTFETWLKAILRQDPDSVMIWEIRDYETLNTATWASLTGHLVLSTLHTKSAADTLDRIINMWLKPYILASALDIIIAQRLARRICSNCKVKKEKTKEEELVIKEMLKDIWIKVTNIEKMELYQWKWCDKCNNSWYKWRIWIYEIINLNDKIREIIRLWWSVAEVIKEARDWDLITLREDWILKAMKWYTTIEEILRVI